MHKVNYTAFAWVTTVLAVHNRYILHLQETLGELERMVVSLLSYPSVVTVDWNLDRKSGFAVTYDFDTYE